MQRKSFAIPFPSRLPPLTTSPPRTCRQPPTNLFRATFDEEVITDLTAKAKTGAMFHLGFALPHTIKAAAESVAIAQANALREMQIAQGERP